MVRQQKRKFFSVSLIKLGVKGAKFGTGFIKSKLDKRKPKAIRSIASKVQTEKKFKRTITLGKSTPSTRKMRLS